MKNDYEIRGDTTVIFIEYKDRVLETLIDTVDLPVADSVDCAWRASRVSKNRDKFYINCAKYIRRNGKTAQHTKSTCLARLLMGFPKGLVVDHINDDSLDNRRSVNLQAITCSENVRKQPKNHKRTAV